MNILSKISDVLGLSIRQTYPLKLVNKTLISSRASKLTAVQFTLALGPNRLKDLVRIEPVNGAVIIERNENDIELKNFSWRAWVTSDRVLTIMFDITASPGNDRYTVSNYGRSLTISPTLIKGITSRITRDRFGVYHIRGLRIHLDK